MQYLNMLSKGLVGEALDQKEKESAAYLECVSMPDLCAHLPDTDDSNPATFKLSTPTYKTFYDVLIR